MGEMCWCGIVGITEIPTDFEHNLYSEVGWWVGGGLGGGEFLQLKNSVRCVMHCAGCTLVVL